jgi:hypothetical protein
MALLQVNDTDKLAIESAQDTTKQLITLATGVVALTITFAKDFVNNAVAANCLALWAWGCFVLSMLFGLWTLLAITGSLSTGATSINTNNITVPARLQILSFLLAMILTVVFGALNR